MTQPTVNLRGHVTFQLISDLNNTNSNTSQEFEVEYVSRRLIRLKAFRETIRDETKTNSFQVNVSASSDFSVVSVSASTEYKGEIRSQYTETIRHESEEEQETTVRRTLKVKVEGHSRMRVYQAHVNLPGMQLDTALVTVPDGQPIPDEQDIVVTVSYPPRRFLKNIDVEYFDHEQMPHSLIADVRGGSSDINKGFGGKYVYLIKEATCNAQEAASFIRLDITGKERKGMEDLAKGAGGDFRYLYIERGGQPIDFDSVVLWRTTSENSRPSERGWQKWTDDLNKGRKGDFLYVAWSY